jgi:hypothetical protein
MSDASPANVVVMATHVLIGLFALHCWFALSSARREGASSFKIAVVISLAFVVSAVNTFVPQMIALRESAFAAQPLMIAGMLLALFAVGYLAGGPSLFRTLDIWLVIGLYGWRAVFGGLLLAIGVLGGLPPAFFWSAAIGDILVGLWALSMLPRSASVGRTELLAWNTAGLVDLAHVLVLGAINLRPFYELHPTVARLGLLPLFGVPLFIALHLHLFRTLWRFNGNTLSTAGRTG